MHFQEVSISPVLDCHQPSHVVWKKIIKTQFDQTYTMFWNFEMLDFKGGSTNPPKIYQQTTSTGSEQEKNRPLWVYSMNSTTVVTWNRPWDGNRNLYKPTRIIKTYVINIDITQPNILFICYVLHYYSAKYGWNNQSDNSICYFSCDSVAMLYLRLNRLNWLNFFASTAGNFYEQWKSIVHWPAFTPLNCTKKT